MYWLSSGSFEKFVRRCQSGTKEPFLSVNKRRFLKAETKSPVEYAKSEPSLDSCSFNPQTVPKSFSAFFFMEPSLLHNSGCEMQNEMNEAKKIGESVIGEGSACFSGSFFSIKVSIPIFEPRASSRIGFME